MRWEIIKKGTSGDNPAPTVEDDKIQDDSVAIEKGKKILYENEPSWNLTTVYFKPELGRVIKISNKYYRILSANIQELPLMTLTVKELPNV